MNVKLGLRGLLLAALSSALVGCLAGPQPEPPFEPDAAPWARDTSPPDDGMDRSDRDGGGVFPPPAPPPSYANDGGPDSGPGGSGEPGAPWLDADGESGLAGGGVAPFPFRPCCGWFALPGADAGPTDAGAD